MINLLLLIVITSLCIFGWHYATLYTPRFDDKNEYQVKPTDREICWWFRFYVVKWFTPQYQKPLVGCLVCMASVYSTISYSVYCFHYDIHFNIIAWAVIAVAVAGLNRIIRALSQL